MGTEEQEQTEKEISQRQLTIKQALNMWQNMSGVDLAPLQKEALDRVVNLIAESYYKKGREDFANNIDTPDIPAIPDTENTSAIPDTEDTIDISGLVCTCGVIITEADRKNNVCWNCARTLTYYSEN